MSLIFINQRCKDCQVKLTAFEADEKQGLCIDCFKEVKSNNKK